APTPTTPATRASSGCRRRRSRIPASLRSRRPRTLRPGPGSTSYGSPTTCTTSSRRASRPSRPTKPRTGSGDTSRAARAAGRRVALAEDAKRGLRRCRARLGVLRPRGRSGRPGGSSALDQGELGGRKRDHPAQTGGGRALRRGRRRIGEHARPPRRASARIQHRCGDRRGNRGAAGLPDRRGRCREGTAAWACRRGAGVHAQRRMAAGRGRLRPDRERNAGPGRAARRAARRANRGRSRLLPGRPPHGARRRRPGRRLRGGRRARGARAPGHEVVRALDGNRGAGRRDAGRRRLGHMSLRLTTAGESHGPALVAIVTGLPAGLVLDRATIDADLARRQQGYGRSPRQKLEQDTVEVLAGLRHGRTLGTPLALVVRNRDHANWEWGMSPWPPEGEPSGKGTKPVTLPRPGHADLAGAEKFGLADPRDALERASARQTAVAVAAGAVAKALLAEIGIDVLGRVVTEALEQRIDEARAERDTVGGVVEVRAHGIPPGLGSYATKEERLDARLAAALMGIQAVKGAEIGAG